MMRSPCGIALLTLQSEGRCNYSINFVGQLLYLDRNCYSLSGSPSLAVANSCYRLLPTVIHRCTLLSTEVHCSSPQYIGVHSYNDPVSQVPCRPRDSGNLFLRSYRVRCNLQVVPYEQSSFSSEKSILHVRLACFASATLRKAEKSSRSLGRKASKLGK